MYEYLQHITIEPGVRSGQPLIKGTRITVSDILGWLGAGRSEAEISEDFPEIQQEHIRAALTFAARREVSIEMVLARAA